MGFMYLNFFCKKLVDLMVFDVSILAHKEYVKVQDQPINWGHNDNLKNIVATNGDNTYWGFLFQIDVKIIIVMVFRKGVNSLTEKLAQIVRNGDHKVDP
jgi:hypothetical protein